MLNLFFFKFYIFVCVGDDANISSLPGDVFVLPRDGGGGFQPYSRRFPAAFLCMGGQYPRVPLALTARSYQY